MDSITDAIPSMYSSTLLFPKILKNTAWTDKTFCHLILATVVIFLLRSDSRIKDQGPTEIPNLPPIERKKLLGQLPRADALDLMVIQAVKGRDNQLITTVRIYHFH